MVNETLHQAGYVEKIPNSRVIAITGANGFIGKHLVNALAERENVSVRILARKPTDQKTLAPNVTELQGDLNEPHTLERFLVPGCTVINLAYSYSTTSKQNLSAVNNLIATCRRIKIKRFVHCSTAAVYGRTKHTIVDESSKCAPKTEYGTTKLSIEKIVFDGSKDHFELVNLRPTAIYGPGGQACMKLINDLLYGNAVANYLRTCVFSDRALNLVHVKNVVAAIVFIMDSDKDITGQTYNICESSDSMNNFRSVEIFLRDRLTNRRYSIPPVPVPLTVLSWILMMLGRDSVDPRTVYSSEKIESIGFQYEISLSTGLEQFSEWYKQEFNMQRDGSI